MTQHDHRSVLRDWRPAELAALVIGFIIYWPLGLVVLAWKYWNDRSRSPRSLDDVVTEGFCRVRAGLRDVFGGGTPASSADEDFFAPTGNDRFDTHVSTELQRINNDRGKLADEVRAFRAFLDQERAGGADVYERFRRQRGDADPTP
ncbi:hypothetical protein FHS82_000350 [Pseudochelatococcus lubricantis]|uniref:DUF2852 domain-containing protein n=1 Tax=Pseudochelatococcus lubricantis TaxID=1538102 RepID=A0ABX0UU97_9HYPH|nr:DUF2852 domain-containing protein [Pseudochelatococcus lubricantis]NIJ56537.1 hypothetical protein [Pseudochelatococcus lubricantis]